MIDHLQAIGRIDPRQVIQIRSLLVRLIERGLRAVRLPLGLALFTLLVQFLTGVIAVRYLLAAGLGSGPITIVVSSLGILAGLTAVFAWLFSRVLKLPQRIEFLSDELCAALERYQNSDAMLDPDVTAKTWRQRVRALTQCGRLAFDLYSLLRNEMQGRTDWTLMAGAAMMSPVFWIVWVVSLAITSMTIVLVLGGCLLHHLLT